MKQNKIIAVTGGIGSGKSTVVGLLNQRGYAVLSCDEIYTELLKDGKFLSGLKALFGDDIVKDGRLDRKKLSALVFSDEAALKKLDGYTHPEIYKELLNRARRAEGTCFCEVPLLFEDGAQALFDGVIVVLRDRDKRLEGVKLRDGCSESQADSRIKSQFNYDNFNFEQYYVIHNNGDLQQLNKNIGEVLKKLCLP